MGKLRSWTIEQLGKAVETSTSIRQVIGKLGLVPAGGNYEQISSTIKVNKINVRHFTGQAWSKGVKIPFRAVIPLEQILIRSSTFQSHKLKRRLFRLNLKPQHCEQCGWATRSEDGRIPLELDHINGDRHDNRLENLRVLCPNCHSLQPTHRGRNRKDRRRGGGMVDAQRLKR